MLTSPLIDYYIIIYIIIAGRYKDLENFYKFNRQSISIKIKKIDS